MCLFIYFFFPHSLLHTLNLLQPSFLTFPFFFLFRLLVSFFAADSSCRTPVLQSPFFFSPFIFPVYLNTQTSCTSFFCFSSCFSSPPTPPPLLFAIHKAPVLFAFFLGCLQNIPLHSFFFFFCFTVACFDVFVVFFFFFFLFFLLLLLLFPRSFLSLLLLMYVSGRFKIGRERKGKENSRETAMAYVSFHIPAAFFLFFFFYLTHRN